MVSPDILTSLIDKRRVVDFLVSQLFHLLLGQNGDFQAPYKQNYKPEVCSFNPHKR